MAAIFAVVLWSSLATLAYLLIEIPPFLLTGIGLIVGSTLALPLSQLKLSNLRVNLKQLVLGVYGLFGYHLALFIALRTAPAAEANLINYMWPLLIVVLAPLYLENAQLTFRLAIGAFLGFAGAGLAVASGGLNDSGFSFGYVFAFTAAIIWATFSLGIKRVGHFPTPSVGVFALIAGFLSINVHLLLEEPVFISDHQWGVLLLLGLGPLGAAFYFWDYAIKKGNPQQIGLISFLTPLLSTVFLLITTGQQLSLLLALSAALIVAGAVIGRVKNGV